MSNWRSYKLKELCSDIIDCVNKTAPLSPIPTPYKMLRTSDIRNGKINLENLNCVSEQTYLLWTRRGKLQKGDVILTREAPLGEVGLVKEPNNYFLGQRLVLLRADPKKADNRFLLYALQFHDNKQAIISKGVGSTVLHLRVPECEKIEIYAPELPQQKKIADILSAYDDLIENNQKQIKLLEEAAQRLYKEWFVDLRFPGWENTKIVDGVPKGWKKTTFGHICTVKKHIINIQENIPSDTPYIGLEHMPRHDFCLSEWGYAQSVSSSKFLFKKGNILFGKIRPYFHKVGFAICNGICSTDAIVMSTEKQLWSLLLMTASSDEFVNHSYQTCKEGSKMPRADWRSMELYPVLIATHEMMNSFNLIIESICSKIEKLALENNLLRESLDVLLQKIMSEKNGGLI